MDDILLDDIIDLKACVNKFPLDFDFRFKMLDQEFSDQIEVISSRTLELLSKLSSYVNSDPSNLDKASKSLSISFDDKDSVFALSDKAVQLLLNSRDLDALDNPPQSIQKEQHPIKDDDLNDIEKRELGDYVVFFSKNVPKPPKFVTPASTYTKMAPIDLIKPLNQVPTIVNTNPPKFDVSNVTIIKDIPNEIKYIDEIIRTFPEGPLFTASLNHRIRTYRPFCSIFLIMTPQYKTYLFDILCLRSNLDPLRKLLMNENVLKIMYDAGEDVQILAESHNMFISPLFDISLIESPLSQRDEIHPLLIEDIVVPHLTKCIVDWRIRPLNDELLSIAVQSVWHLPNIANEVILRNKDRFLESINDSNNSWYSFGRMPNLPYVFDHGEAEKKADEVLRLDQQLSEEDKDIIFELVKWRDSIAVIEEESPNFIATDEALLRIAKGRPLTIDSLALCLEELQTPQLSTYSNDIILIVKNNSSHKETKSVFSLLNKV